MFDDWSPAQLATALGYRIDLRSEAWGERTAFLVGHDRPFSHSKMCAVLSRVARMRGIDPFSPPNITPRALLNGKEQEA